MIFEIINSKALHPLIVYNDKIIKKTDLKDPTMTWAYHPSIDLKTVKIIEIFVAGKHLDEVAPEHLKHAWEENKKQYKIYEKTFKESKINLDEHCLYDYLPEDFLIKYFSIKNEITKYVSEHYPEPENYDLLANLCQLTHEIAEHKLNIDYSFFEKIENRNRAVSLENKIKKMDLSIKYNPFGTITGRLTTKKNSFPILTLDKQYRSILKPNNDFFIELDYNAADLRAFLYLMNISQPHIDLHDWHKSLYEKAFNTEITRNEMKVKFLAWLYSGSYEKFNIPEIDNSYNKKTVLEKYWNGKTARTPFYREIETDEKKALPTITQSTCTDIFFLNVFKIRNFLEENKTKTYIAALIHDNIILDCSKNDIKLLKQIIDLFSNVEDQRWLTKIKVGKNLGQMVPINSI